MGVYLGYSKVYFVLHESFQFVCLASVRRIHSSSSLQVKALSMLKIPPGSKFSPSHTYSVSHSDHEGSMLSSYFNTVVFGENKGWE